MPHYKITVLNLDQERKVEEEIDTLFLQDALLKFTRDFQSGKLKVRPVTVEETALERFSSVFRSFTEGKMSLKAALDVVGEILERAAGGGIR